MYETLLFFTIQTLHALRVPLIFDTVFLIVVWGVCWLGQSVVSPALRCYLWRLTYVKLLLTLLLMGSGIPIQIPDLPSLTIIQTNPPPPDVRAADPALQNIAAPTYAIGNYPHSLLWVIEKIVEPYAVTVNPVRDGNRSGYSLTVDPKGVTAITINPTGDGDRSGPAELWIHNASVARTYGLIYFCGFLLFFLRMLRALRRARRLRSAAQPVADEASRTALEDISRHLGLRRAPRLGQVPALPGPLYTAGTILIPSEGLPAGTQRLILAHEAAHARRRDLVWEWLGALTQALFFFHPLVYLARREERIARESAADAIALRLTGASAAEYARMLLDLSTKAQKPFTGAVGAIESGSALYRRIATLKKPRNRAGLIDKALVALVTLLLTTAIVPIMVLGAKLPYDFDTKKWFPKDDPYPHAPKDPFQIKGNKHLCGVVRDSHGKPISGLWVQVWRTFFAGDGPREVRVAWSDLNGRFDFPNLPPGEYQMWAADCQIQGVDFSSDPNETYGFPPELEAIARKLPAHVHAATFYFFGRVPTFYIAPFQHGIVEQDITAYRSSTVRGRLIDRVTGAPIVGIAIGDASGSGNSLAHISGGLAQSVTDAGGRFTLDIDKPGRTNIGAGMFTDNNLRAVSFRVAAVQTSCIARENETVVLPDMVTDRLPILRFVGPRHEPLGRIRVDLTPKEAENYPDLGNFDTRGQQRGDADERGDLLIFRLKSGAFSATTGDGRLAVSGAFRQAPNNSLEVTVNGVHTSFADGIAVIKATMARSTATEATVAKP